MWATKLMWATCVAGNSQTSRAKLLTLCGQEKHKTYRNIIIRFGKYFRPFAAFEGEDTRRVGFTLPT